MQPPSLRVLTWNIAAGHGDLFHIADVLQSLRPDVAALQEVDRYWEARSGFEDQPARLARALDMDARFAPIYRLAGASGAPAREFGVAILSRLPIVEFTNHAIPRLSTQVKTTEPERLPGFPEAVIAVGGHRVRVFNTHLDYRADPRVRRLQVAAMLDLIGDASRPTLLAGDLNAPPAAPELAPLLRRLRDAWPPGGDPGFTYPALAPARRIDYLLCSNDLRVLTVRVPETTASDHRPVVADLDFTS